MKYAIKLENGRGGWLRNFNDRTRGESDVITFDEPGEAEVYAQNHEIKNYVVGAVEQFTRIDGKELLT